MGKEEGITGDFNVEAAKPNNFTQRTIKGYSGTGEAAKVKAASEDRYNGLTNLGDKIRNPGPRIGS